MSKLRQGLRGRARDVLGYSFLAVLVGVLAGCGEDAASPIEPIDAPPLSLAMTSGDASAEFSLQGEFGSAYLTLPTDGVDEAHAVEVATAFVKHHIWPFQESLERQAGRLIDLESLVPMRRVFFAETPYDALPAQHPTPLRAAVGPKYIVSFRDRSGPALAVSISVHVKEYSVDPAGTLSWPRAYGNQFRMIGISRSGIVGPPISPEKVVAEVWAQTGARTTEVPVFVWRGAGFAPTIGAWRLRLDRTVTLETSAGSLLNTQEVYVDGKGNSFASSGTPRSSVNQSSGEVLANPRRDLGEEWVQGTLRASEVNQ